jgi:GTPase SAR1 family protein
MSSAQKLKVVLLGEGAVGKTSLVLQYTAGRFDDQHHVTLQVRYTLVYVLLRRERGGKRRDAVFVFVFVFVFTCVCVCVCMSVW